MTVYFDIGEAAPHGGVGIDNALVTIGNFDGVHAGHRALLKSLREARGGSVVVVTFDPHPAVVLAPERAPESLTSVAQKVELLREAGADVVVIQPFDRALASLTAEQFIERFLAGPVRAAEVHVGYDFRFGRGRAGDFATLEREGARLGFRAVRVEATTVDGEPASSTRIRTALAAGDVALSARLLGRAHEVAGVVVEGDRRGRELGYPTANLGEPEGMLPANGIYACRVRVVNAPQAPAGHVEAVFDAVTNVGVNPTFEGARARRVEPYLLDFSGDLYGRRIEVAFVARVRDELRFTSVEALKEQIADDVRVGRALLDAHRTLARF